MASKYLKPDDLQAQLTLVRSAEPNEVPLEMIRRQRSAAAAFALACQSSGLEDKEIYGGLDVDAGYFSRMKAGNATLQADLLERFCTIVANRIYPEWLAFQIGCTLVQIKSDAERRAETLAAQLDEQRRENRLLRDLVQGRAVA